MKSEAAQEHNGFKSPYRLNVLPEDIDRIILSPIKANPRKLNSSLDANNKSDLIMIFS